MKESVKNLINAATYAAYVLRQAANFAEAQCYHEQCDIYDDAAKSLAQAIAEVQAEEVQNER